MNNLKFRVWDKTNKETLNIDVLNLFLEEIVVLENDGSAFSMKFKDVELMQSTGLFDKDGKEIFEGDILKTRTRGYVIVKKENGNTMTTYKSGINKRTSLVLSSFLEKYQVKIVGNIYENKDLLEE